MLISLAKFLNWVIIANLTEEKKPRLGSIYDLPNIAKKDWSRGETIFYLMLFTAYHSTTFVMIVQSHSV